MVRFKAFLKIAVILFFSFVILFFLADAVFNLTYQPAQNIEYGVSFSPGYAKYLKLDWQKTYTLILDDLKVKNLRIPSYWDVLEPEKGKYDFSETDYMLDEAKKRGAQALLVLGVKQPRWPECHTPLWAGKLSVPERQQKILEFVKKTVNRYKDNSSVRAWQVENEPFLFGFGEGCDRPDANFLRAEINLVKSLSNKKIIVSDSGELGSWIVPMQTSDIFGTTLYRQVWDKFLRYVTYPVPPYFYTLKSDLIKSMFAPRNQKTIIVELQSEPWLAGGDFISVKEQSQVFTINQFKNYMNFAKKTGFDEMYLWGAEWWYFMEANGHPEYLNYAKTLFR